METQGQRIKKIRTSLGLTQTALGADLKMSKQYFSKAETDSIVLNNKQLVILCVDHNVNINYLLTGRGEMFIKKEQPAGFKEEIKQAIQEMLASGELSKDKFY